MTGFVIYQQHQMSVMQEQINTSMVAQKALLDGITRSQAEYATKKDLDAFAAANGVNLAAIQKDVATLNASITGMNQISVNSGGNNENNVPSTNIIKNPTPPDTPTVACNGKLIPCPSADPYNYQKTEQVLQLAEPFGSQQVPIGNVGFSASQQNPWNINTLPRTYNVSNVIATDQNGRQFVYNQFSIKAGGKNYKLPITKGEFVQQYPSPSFSFWNPRLFLTSGGSVGITPPIKGSMDVGLTLGIMSYGQSKISPAISVLQLGVGYETGTQKPAAIVNPVNFSLSGLLPKGLVDSTYIGPSVQVDTTGNVFAGANLSLGF